ncbi:hypothetical protein L596_025695 [Steinernema carpocapsae]|uniref:Protein kinase domain-containing protein n=1 Tax=Steinernema carpocapsae TaxID=34508 RepID=A0A4U5M8K1_STECR|nr:hypothetical protein L596_025695 [Steinernema carpocapsae]
MCGPNIDDLRRSRKGNKFSLACSINIGIQVIEALRQLHDAGFIHCDVKGSNLVPGLGRRQEDLFDRPGHELPVLRRPEEDRPAS